MQRNPFAVLSYRWLINSVFINIPRKVTNEIVTNTTRECLFYLTLGLVERILTLVNFQYVCFFKSRSVIRTLAHAAIPSFTALLRRMRYVVLINHDLYYGLLITWSESSHEHKLSVSMGTVISVRLCDSHAFKVCVISFYVDLILSPKSKHVWPNRTARP